MTAIDVRPYEGRDEEPVVALWCEVFPGDPPWNEPRAVIRQKLGVQRELFLVATSEDAVIGTAMGGFDGHRGWVYSVAVAPRARRRGVGRALMRAVETALEARGCVKLNLQVRAGNASVVAFYERLGYAVEPRVSLGKRLGGSPEPSTVS